MGIETLLPSQTSAILALADGSVFQGISIGASGETQGEVVFNTAMTGYQEILTDPSYAQQIVTLTYPHIGNTGINDEDNESFQPWAAGLIIRTLSPIVSNWRAKISLHDYLKKHNIIAIAGIDTRRLTRLLRDKGAQNGCIITDVVDPAIAVEKALAFSGLENKDLAKYVSRQQNQVRDCDAPEYHVIVYDFGVKENILRRLQMRNCRLTIVPAKTTSDSVLALKPDGVVLSNGPGDPAACDYAVKAIRSLIKNEIPIFGICLGFQLLALACGAKTIKMKFGHHGSNHPVQDLKTKKVFITSQNHGFAVDRSTLPDCLQQTHLSLFDNSLQGIAHNSAPAMAFQGHPEAGPGPHDIDYLFDQFIELMSTYAKMQ